MVVKYENLPSSWISFYRKYEDLVKYLHYDNFYAKYDGVTNEPNQIKFTSEFSVHWPLISITFEKPTETLYFKHIYYPKYVPKYQKFNPFFTPQNLYKSAFLKDLHWPHCSIGGDYVNTYDNVLYKYPQTDCWQLAVKDAHKEDHFTILYKSIKHATLKKAMEVFFNHQKIELLPLDESSPLVIRVDGVQQTLTEEVPVILTDAQGHVHTLIVLYSDYYVIINYIDDIMILFNGDQITISANEYDRGHLAGLCGDFNAETYHEFEGPDHCIYKNPLNFAYSWSVKADSCTIPEHVHECH